MKQFLIAAALLSFGAVSSQVCDKENALRSQGDLNKQYADPKESPLTPEGLKSFKALEFYGIDMAYCVEARFVRTPHEKPFLMPTTTERKPRYVKFGEVYFTLEGKECKLDIFQNLEMVKIDKYKDALFLPFTDLTSGNGSYGGGRYIDLTIPEGDTIVIDFNTCYNPYCAYSHNYSCPIPPPQNDLPVEIRAGVKEYKK